MKKRTAYEKLSLTLSLLTTILLIPFALLRWSDGDFYLALLDATISLSSFLFFVFIYITGNIDAVKKPFAMLLVLALLTTFLFKGESQVPWIPPAIIAMYFLLPLTLAGTASIILILASLLIIYPDIDTFALFTIFSTTGLTTALSYAIFKSYNHKQDELALLAAVDALTGAGNRRALDKKLNKIIASQYRESHTMCLILIDLDKFKEINDNYGHAVGDQILVSVCELITRHTRALDSLYRYGGDEFLIVPMSMNIDIARKLGEKIRNVIEKHEFSHKLKLTISIGVAEYENHDTPEIWISRADTALYKAKELGRNNVC